MRTLTMDTSASPFHELHTRILGGLDKGSDAPPPPESASLCDKYDADVCEAARATWLQRMVNEHRSSAVFASLVPQLIEASSTIDVQTAVLRAATDEIYHATLCGNVVRAFGGEARATAEPTLALMPVHAGVSPLERAMRNVMFVGCLSETVAVGLITEERELAVEPFVQWTLARVLSDEIAHARLGWQFLAQSLERLEPEARTRTAAYLRVAFAYLERREIELLNVTGAMPTEIVAQREAIGLCSGDGARELFYATLETVIVPRFESLGIAAQKAWSTRSEVAAA